MVKFEIEASFDEWIIKLVLGSTHVYSDSSVALAVGVDYQEFKDTLIRKFNAQLDPCGETYFPSIQDARDAIEWLTSAYMAKLLRKNA